MQKNGGTNLRKYEREDFGWTLCGTPLDIFDTHSCTIYNRSLSSPLHSQIISKEHTVLYSRDTFHFHFLYFLRWVLCLGLTCSVTSIWKWRRKVRYPMTIIRKRRRQIRSPMTIIRKRRRKIRSPISDWKTTRQFILTFQPNNFDTFLHLSSPKNLPLICQLEKCVDMYRADIFVIFGSQLAAPLYKPLITLQTDR